LLALLHHPLRFLHLLFCQLHWAHLPLAPPLLGLLLLLRLSVLLLLLCKGPPCDENENYCKRQSHHAHSVSSRNSPPVESARRTLSNRGHGPIFFRTVSMNPAQRAALHRNAMLIDVSKGAGVAGLFCSLRPSGSWTSLLFSASRAGGHSRRCRPRPEAVPHRRCFN